MTQTHPPLASSLGQTLQNAFRPQEGAVGEPASDSLPLSLIMTRLEHQALSLLIILLALPNCLPTPPGFSAFTGLPLLILTTQMAMSRPPWLPPRIAERRLPRASLLGMIARAEPWFMRIERLLHPRLSVLTGDTAQRLVGVVGVFLSVLILLPIPFGNIGPALALIIFALGFLGRDGAWVIAGVFATGFALAMILAIYGTALWALMAGLGAS